MSNSNQLRLSAHARHAIHRLRPRRHDHFAELISQTRRKLEHELAEVESALHIAQVERDAAELRYRHAHAIAAERRDDLRRRLAVL